MLVCVMGCGYGRSGWVKLVMRFISLFAISTRPNASSGTLPLELTSLRMKSCERFMKGVGLWSSDVTEERRRLPMLCLTTIPLRCWMQVR